MKKIQSWTRQEDTRTRGWLEPVFEYFRETRQRSRRSRKAKNPEEGWDEAYHRIKTVKNAAGEPKYVKVVETDVIIHVLVKENRFVTLDNNSINRVIRKVAIV